MASERQIAANRRNALKSTGPRTDAGKARSRLNAVTHGLNAHIETLPDDEKAEFEQRVVSWNASFQPGTPYEEQLVRRAVSLSWRIERAERAQAALLAESLDQATLDEIRQKREEFEDAAHRLLPDLAPEGSPPPPPGPRCKVGEFFYHIDDPNDPLVLVTRLERNIHGCNWMRERLAELRTIPDAGKAWNDAELTRALRLIGHRPLDAVEDHEVLRFIVANFIMDQSRPDPFSALWNGLNAIEIEAYRQRLIGRRLRQSRPPTAEAAREFLLGIIDETSDRLEALESELIDRDAALAETRPFTHLFDDSAEGQWVRSKQRQYNHALARIVERFRKARRLGQPMTADPPPGRRPTRPKAPKPLVALTPKPYISPSARRAAERWKRGIRYRKRVVPPWRSPGSFTRFKPYPGYPPPPHPVRPRRKVSKKRFYRTLNKMVGFFKSVGMLTVLIALFLPWTGGPEFAKGQRPTTPDGRVERAQGSVTADPTEDITHEAREGISSSSFPMFGGAHSNRPVGQVRSGAEVRGGGRTGPMKAVFRDPTAGTPAKTQNEANFGAILRVVRAVEAAPARRWDRSRGPPRARFAGFKAARPPPEASLTVPP
jgi:hypothetical protein